MSVRAAMTAPTVVIVPGLRDAVPAHWQTLLEADLRARGRPVTSVPPMGRDALACQARVTALEQAVQAVVGPLVLVAHSGGCITVAHWARHSTRPVLGALLAAPPDFEQPMPEGYPSLQALAASGWLPVPRTGLPFPSIVAASQDDPLSTCERSASLAHDWGSQTVDLGQVGHLNPASGFGPWPRALDFIDQLSTGV